MRVFLFALLAMLAAPGFCDSFDAVEEKLKAAMEAEIRTDAEKARDANRRPVETLRFFGLRDDMRVLELMPGGGWYTKLLAPVMQDNGVLYVALNTWQVAKDLAAEWGFEDMQIIATDSRVYRDEEAGVVRLETGGFGVTDLDMILTFRNYHNFGPEDRAAMNKACFDALKPGGIYAVVDHTRRHMEADNYENHRRFDPVLAIQEIQEAGFRFVDYSDLHYRADDELRYEVGRRTVTGNTDRWTLKFVKP